MHRAHYSRRRAASSGELFDLIFEDLREVNHPSRLYILARAAADRVFQGFADYHSTFDDLWLAAVCVGLEQELVQRCICTAFASARRAHGVAA